MSLTDEQIDALEAPCWFRVEHGIELDRTSFARAIESAATAPLLNRIAELEQELTHYRNLFTTADKHVVKPGDNVWVRGTGGWKRTTVCEAVTNYMYFDNVKVSESYYEDPI